MGEESSREGSKSPNNEREVKRSRAEDERQLAEEVRISSEHLRKEAEEKREEAEEARTRGERSRYSQEQERLLDERQRQLNEATRHAAEVLDQLEKQTQRWCARELDKLAAKSSAPIASSGSQESLCTGVLSHSSRTSSPRCVILLRAGDSVPADCRLLEAFSVRIIAVLAMAMAARRMAKPERR
jgi:hypothetical protein